MSLSIYTYSNPYEIHNEPYWESIKNCAHFCVSQTMVNGLSEVYSDLNLGQLATIQDLVDTLYPHWFDTRTYIEQYTALTNILDSVRPKMPADAWVRIKQSLRFNKSAMLDSIRLLIEMDVRFEDIKLNKISEEQSYLAATYKKALSECSKLFSIKRKFSSQEIDNAVKGALVALDKRRERTPHSIAHVDCDTVIIHGVHQFTPTILSAIEAVSNSNKRVILLFNYQEQYREIYQTWLDVYSCFDLNIKSQFNNEFHPTQLLPASYVGNVLADKLARISGGEYTEKGVDLSSVSVLEFDNITEFSAYVAKIYEDAVRKHEADSEKKNASVLFYMSEQFYSANNEVNDILKVYFPEQFGERHFLAYPIGHFFVAVTNMWNNEEGGIRIEDMNDVAECLCSDALPEKSVGSLISTFNATKNYFSRATCLIGEDEDEGIVDLLRRLRRQKKKIDKGDTELKTQLLRLNYYNVSIAEIDDLIEALTLLDKITKLFYEDFENEENNFRHFYEKVREFIEQQVLPTAETESEFKDILLRLLARLEETEKMESTSSFDCLKETMAYYLKQNKHKGESANWIVRDFQQIDGDILKSANQDPDIIYHFACVSDADMSVKREDQFPWPLDIEFFDKAYEPLDWKYQVYIKSRREFKHFKRYALIYGLEFNRCRFKLSYVKNDDDRQNELYYMLRLLGIGKDPNQHDTTLGKADSQFNFDFGVNKHNFNHMDVYRRRICDYRFGIETLIEGGTKYKDKFLQEKYFEIVLANIVRYKLKGSPATEDVMNASISEEAEELRRYFRFINESELTDIKTNVKNALRKQPLQDGKLKVFPSDIKPMDAEIMDKKEEFIYVHLENEERVNVLNGKFNTPSREEKMTFTADRLKAATFEKHSDIWCQWCADRELCLEYYKSLIEQ